jgi:crotonobetainyl-CoA:carnitine CoA-transferase CaiB-like acyl-CoA transferase
MLLAELGADVIRVDRPERTGLPVAPSTTLARSRPSLALDLSARPAAAARSSTSPWWTVPHP